MEEEKGEDGCARVLERDEGGEERKEYDFDRGKVGALDREASREGGTIGSSPCRSARRRERFALATRRFPSSEFSRFSITSTIERRTLSFATLQRVENLTNDILPAYYDSRDMSRRNFDTRHTSLSLSVLEEIFAHLSFA